MPRITTYGYSNADTVNEPPLFDQQGGVRIPITTPKKNVSHVVLGGAPSAGMSSSTSGSKPEPSGSSPQETEQSIQSPARDAENPSGLDPAAKQAQSSTAPSTDGSTQGTGRGRARQQDSSAESAPATPATPDTTDLKKLDDAQEMLHLARQAFDSADYDLAEEMLNEAESMDATLQDKINAAREEVEAARKSKSAKK